MLASLGMEILRLQHGWRSSPKDDLNTILSVAFPQLFTNSPCSDRTERNEEDKHLLQRIWSSNGADEAKEANPSFPTANAAPVLALNFTT